MNQLESDNNIELHVDQHEGTENNQGPCQILPAENIYTTDPDGRVKITLETTGIGANPPISVPGLLMRAGERFPDNIALAEKNETGCWKTWTYSEYLQEVKTTAKAFIKLGLKKHHSVGILGFNSPEWFFSKLAAIFAGGIAMGIYISNSADACCYCANHSRANIIVVEDSIQLEKILKVRDRLPLLKAIILINGESDQPGVYTWKQMREIGEKEPDYELDKALKSVAINEVAVIVYTSGTVGHPKAVMMTHDNLTFDALSTSQAMGMELGRDVIVSYLPLSHVAAQALDVFIAITCGSSVYFADRTALKGTLVQTLKEVQPTRFLGVPRVWEKIFEKMQEIESKNSGLKTIFLDWAKAQGFQRNMDRFNGNLTHSWSYWLASLLVFKKVKASLGLGRCKTLISGAAPISQKIKTYFMSLDIPLVEAFGMSECMCHTLGNPNHNSLDSVGKTLPGMQTKIINPDIDGNGEICMYGRNIFIGYLNNPEKTAEAIDTDGFLRSGDIGKVDDDGFVYITGRIKEIIITAGGENVAPVQVENLVKAELPHLSNVLLVGDQKKFLAVLVTLKTEVDSDTGVPLDNLTDCCRTWLKTLDCSATTVKDVLEAGPHPKVLAAIQEGITRANKHAISNAQRIQKFAILPADFSLPAGDLGPTLKIKRHVIVQKYKDIIDKLYE